MSQETHPAVERLPLYKAVDSGRRTNEVVVELDYRPATTAEIWSALDFPSDEDVEVFVRRFNEETASASFPRRVRAALQAVADARRTEEE